MKPPRKPIARLTVERQGAEVRMIFACEDEYRAMKLYDELTAQSEAGQIGLALDVGAQSA
jgi:hypothetical protein